MVGDMEYLKIKVNNEDESKEIQELLFEFGCYWAGRKNKDNVIEETNGRYIFSRRGEMTHCESSEVELNGVGFSLKEITLQQLRDLVVLKRNDVNDATYVDSHLFKVYIDSDYKIYYFEQRQFNNGQYNTWVERCINNHMPELLKDEYISELKPIENEVKLKEFLNPEQGYALVECFVGETSIPKSWIEVPEGAEIFLLDESSGEDNLYFVKHDGEVFCEYSVDATGVQNNIWIKGIIKVLHKGMGKVLWQRNRTTTLNTSTQDKLKFIEKWLNGEKIQYILGVDSEKTQWHNFTEGAMQYIKRSDIKFREAPKYVTINGIEFKSVESLLKHVKNNFDLDDGE